VRGYGEEAD
jgi:hypothetical protein